MPTCTRMHCDLCPQHPRLSISTVGNSASLQAREQVLFMSSRTTPEAKSRLKYLVVLLKNQLLDWCQNENRLCSGQYGMHRIILPWLTTFTVNTANVPCKQTVWIYIPPLLKQSIGYYWFIFCWSINWQIHLASAASWLKHLERPTWSLFFAVFLP